MSEDCHASNNREDMLGQYAILKLIKENDRLHAVNNVLRAALEGCMLYMDDDLSDSTMKILAMCREAMRKAEQEVRP